MHDIIVCGAGPAGSVVARRLAAAGARVALVGMDSRPSWEGLSARSRALLIEEGAVPSEAGFGRETDILVGPFLRRGIWAGGRVVAGTEWLVERSRLATALRALAISAGAVHEPDFALSATRSADHWWVRLRSGKVLAAPLLIDARGRRGAQRRGPCLLSFGQRFRTSATGRAGTGIGVTDSSWCWWARHEDLLWVQIVGQPRAGHPASWLPAAAAQIPALQEVLAFAVAAGEPVARPAHARLGLGQGDPTRWQVGDAAVAHDPLSGQGIYEALRGAQLVATAVQSLREGGDALPAHRFVAERQEAVWQRGVAIAAEFYRELGERGAFWRNTAAAYARLLPEQALLAQPAVAPRIERRPVLIEGRILERDVIVTAQHPRGVWHIGGVPLAPLKNYFDTAEPATIAGAVAALDRPQAAVVSAIYWLQKTGTMLRQVPPNISSGG